MDIDRGGRLSLRPDVRGFHDRPPFFDLGLLNGAERFRRLLSEREDVLPQFGKPLAYQRVGQRPHSCSRQRIIVIMRRSANVWRRPCRRMVGALCLRLRSRGECSPSKLNAKPRPRRDQRARMGPLRSEARLIDRRSDGPLNSVPRPYIRRVGVGAPEALRRSARQRPPTRMFAAGERADFKVTFSTHSGVCTVRSQRRGC
jgi:hypothetical protein